MKYNRLHINQFGTLQNRTIDFSDGINVIHNHSEDDKYALCAFIEAMHFGMDPSRNTTGEEDLYSRFYPEEGRSTYGGVLEFTENGHVYSIFRNFRRDPMGLTLMDETSNRSNPLTEDEYQDLMHHMTDALYRDALGLNPLTATGSRELAAQLQMHITNLRTTGSASLDIEKTKSQLMSDRASMEEKYSQEAEDRQDTLTRQLQELTAERDKLPGLSDYSQGESERNRLQSELSQLLHRQEELTTQIQTHETILKEHSRYATISMKEAEDRCQRLLARREKLLKHYPEPSTSLISRLSPTLSVLMAVLTLAGLIFGIFSVTHGQYTNGSIGILVTLVGIFFLPRLFRRWSSMRHFYYVDKELKELYQEILADAPDYVTQDNLKDFIETMNGLKSHRRSLAQCRKEVRTINEQLTERKDQFKRLQEFLEEKRKDIIKKQLIDEHICRLEAEQEALIPVLDNNEQIRIELEAIDTALNKIEELSNQAYRVFTSFLQDNTSQLLSQLYEGQDVRIEIPEEDPVTLIYEGRRAQLHQLDCGTLEQIYLALRIACIRFFWPKDSMPILMDNSFRRCDEVKFTQTMAWLTNSGLGQYFIFTGQDTESRLLEQAGIPFATVEL